MTVTVADIAGRIGLKSNDPKAIEALTAALSWARSTLCRAVDDDLDDLEPHNWQAVAGYARDLIKLPGAVFGYFDLNADEGLAAAVGDIGRRWRPLLCQGAQHTFGFA